MGTNCAPLVVDLFAYSLEAYFIQGTFKRIDKTGHSFNFTLFYTDAVLSLNNYRFCDFVDSELLLNKETTKSMVPIG
jgi:hypothetical protein